MTRFWILPVLAAMLTFTGCGKPGSEAVSPPPSEASGSGTSVAATAPDPLDLSELRSAFVTANPGLRIFIDETIASVKARDFAYAHGQLHKISTNAQLTAQQVQSVQRALTKVQSMASSNRQP